MSKTVQVSKLSKNVWPALAKLTTLKGTAKD